MPDYPQFPQVHPQPAIGRNPFGAGESVAWVEVAVHNLALPAAADQQADGPRAKWVGRLTFRLRAPTAAVPVVHSGDTLWLRPVGLTERRGVCWQSPPARFRYGRIMDLSTTQRGTGVGVGARGGYRADR